jgi:cytidine deaminase
MVKELERLLSNAYAPYDQICFSCVVVMKDHTTFGGVTVKNAIYRDAIYAEQAAIGRAVAAGYKYGDFDRIYVMVGSNNLNDLKYLNKDVIIEFMEPSAEVFLYDLNRNERILKVGNLLFNIY